MRPQWRQHDSWECSGVVSGVLHALSLKEQAGDCEERVSLDFDVLKEMLEALKTDLAERTGGRVLVRSRKTTGESRRL